MANHHSLEIKGLIKQFFKVVVWSFVKHRQGDKKNVLLFATRRGGSTWMMEILGANPGMTFIDHAFSIYTASKHCLSYLPITEDGHIRTLDDPTKDKIRTYINEIYTNDLRLNAPWKFWDSNFNFRTSRIAVKITAAKSVIEFFEEFDSHMIYFTRHPIACGLAAIRNNWGLHLKGYVENKNFIDKHLSKEQYSLCSKIYEGGSLIEKHVLNWVLENLIPIRLMQTKEWLYVSYEHLVVNKEEEIQKIADYLEIADPSYMLKQAGLPSRSTKRLSKAETEKMIRSGASEELVGKWIKNVSEEDLKASQAILDTFDIKLYAANQIMPQVEKN